MTYHLGDNKKKKYVTYISFYVRINEGNYDDNFNKIILNNIVRVYMCGNAGNFAEQ